MRGFIFAAIVATPLAACANLQTAANDADCRHLLSPQGEPLRFCETGDRVTVDDKPIDTERAAGARLIDDPKFLAAMVAQLPKPKTASSHRHDPAPRVCESEGADYITISASDLETLIRSKTEIASNDIPTSSASPTSQHDELNTTSH
jgi:hypothetical protein